MEIKTTIGEIDQIKELGKPLNTTVRIIISENDSEIPDPSSSKWTKIAQRVHDDPELKKPEVQEALSQMKESMKEFRENFAFHHDS